MTAVGETTTTDTTCSACRRPVRIVLTDGGLRIKTDPGLHEDGTVVVRSLPDGTVRARVLGGHEMPHPGGAYRDHRRTCPTSAHAVRRAHAAAPTCLGCKGRLDPVLAARPGWTARYHPCCAPSAAPDRQEMTA